ncbi:MAG: hypothetical protein K6G16_04920 [Lachnospiraceae bacterium]|nr:hypothetical protein [Lachnospiraceae bacterium]
MNRHYRNFRTVVYIPAQVASRFTPESLASDHAFLEKTIGLDKVYLESHRDGCDVDKEQLLMIKSFLEEKGVTVSGGITTTIDDFEGTEKGKRRIFHTFCYTDPAMRERLKEISAYTASLFDEIILDDFFFTNCTCERCIREKGDRDWTTFRRELMRDVSENLIVKPAKAVNPGVKMVIKYPNWRESYHFDGYVPEVQREIFDATYTGTETRSPAFADQHLPEYLSYSLVRWMDNAWPGRNGGGWFDPFQCWSTDRYLEQAYLTAFAQAGELMHFCWSDLLIDSPFVAAMGIQLKKIDALMDGTGKPKGVPVYLPFASSGENHLEMRLGMLGLPIEATPFFPEKAEKLLLTESALTDDQIIDKLVRFVENGGDAVITSGFFREAQEKLRSAGLTEARLTGRRYAVTRYHVTGDDAGYILDRKPILFPEIVHGNNDSWSLLNGGDGDLHASILLRSTYGKGRLYLFAVPDNDADLYRMPAEAVDVLKRTLLDGSLDTYVSGADFSMFSYDDGSFILYRYVKGDVRPAHVTVRTRKPVKALVDTHTDPRFPEGRRFPAHPVTVQEDFEEYTEYCADVMLIPGLFRKYRWE